MSNISSWETVSSDSEGSVVVGAAVSRPKSHEYVEAADDNVNNKAIRERGARVNGIRSILRELWTEMQSVQTMRGRIAHRRVSPQLHDTPEFLDQMGRALRYDLRDIERRYAELQEIVQEYESEVGKSAYVL